MEIKDFPKFVYRFYPQGAIRHCKKIESSLYTLIYLKVRRKKKSEKLQLKGGISELNFGYNAKMEGYTNSSSDIPKLYERASQDKEKSI